MFCQHQVLVEDSAPQTHGMGMAKQDPPEGVDSAVFSQISEPESGPSCLTAAGTSLYERQHRGLSQSHRPISNIILPRSWTS